MHESSGKEPTKCRVYKAENISTDKMLDALSYMREVAHQNHMNGMYRTVKPDDFCSYGERRTENGNQA